SNIPPPDGLIVWIEVCASTLSKITIVSLSGIGTLLSVSAIGYLFKHKSNPMIRASSVPHCTFAIFGIMVGYGSAILYALNPSEITCRYRESLLLIGSLILSTNLVCKNVVLAILYGSKEKILQPYRLVQKFQLVAVVISVINT
ncbi:hypothetical protein HK100_009285, partial [Physocladia obscura]